MPYVPARTQADRSAAQAVPQVLHSIAATIPSVYLQCLPRLKRLHLLKSSTDLASIHIARTDRVQYLSGY